MTLTPDVEHAIEAARAEAHVIVDQSFNALIERLKPAPSTVLGITIFKDPTEEDCRDPRAKEGRNLSLDGVELLFRLLDGGAGYNSAGRKLSITQSAVKNRKADWIKAGGVNRVKRYIPWIDTIA